MTSWFWTGPQSCQTPHGSLPPGPVCDGNCCTEITSCHFSGRDLPQPEESASGGFRGKLPWRSVMRKSIWLSILAIAALAIWTGAQAGDDKDKPHGMDKDHVVVRADDVKWGPGPPHLPAGAKATALSGDPSKAVPYVLRAKLPDGYKVPPHWHPTTENVTVLKGTLMVGKGEKFDADASVALTAGGFASMPKGMRHFAWTKGETIIQIHG